MDSANRTFLTMVILTIVFFGLTMSMDILKKDNNITPDNKENYKEIKNEIITIKENSIFEVINEQTQIQETIIIDNENLKIELNTRKGTVKNAWIKSADNNEYNIVNGTNINQSLEIKLGAWDTGKTISDLTGNKERYELTINDNVYLFTLKLKNSSDNSEYIIKKKYTFIPEEYVFALDIAISNNQNKPFNFDNSNKVFSIGWGPSMGVSSMSNNERNPRYDMYGYMSEKKLNNIKEKDKIFKTNNSLFAEVNKKVNDTWITANSHYNAAVLIPIDNNGEYSYFFDYRDIKNNVSYCGFSKKTENSVVQSSFVIYLGPKYSKVLKKYDNFHKDTVHITDSKLSKLDGKIMFGLGNFIGHILNFIFKYFKNYGLAIIILTLIIKILLFPLTHHSMVSQQKMQTVQPKMKELQEKYKDKPDLLNKKTMELYSKEKINPLSGCLPLLLQMPILFAMYNLLDRMVELKGASFLWIKDLAMPDALFSFSFVIPILKSSSLNILPIIMVVTQILTSLLTPDVQSNKQAKMMMWMMPIMFFFFFYNASSALVLYWTVMNILGIFQQMYIRYRGKQVSVTKK